MMRKTFGAALAAAALTATCSFGQVDRWLDQPTGWSYLYSATSAQIAALGASQRVFNIERVGSNAYDVVAVTNSGSYQVSGMQIHYGQTAASLGNLLESSNRRLIDLEPYANGSVENFVAITVPNTGATAAGWGWLYRATPQQIADWIGNANPPLRLLDLDVYELNGQQYYSAVAVNNTGSNNQGWWYYFARTAGEVTSLLTENQARLVDVEVHRQPGVGVPALYTVLMVADNPGSGWWYPALTQAEIGSLLEQNGARLTCIERYTNALNQTRFAVAMVDNTTPETRRIRDAIRENIPSGDFGFKAKQVGGPTIASLNENFQFEPASMIKILHAARAMRGVELGNETLGSLVTLNVDTFGNSSCPVATTTTFPSLETTIRQVMRNSSNEHTEALRRRYTTNGLMQFATTYGLAGTSLNHTIGCLCSEWPDFNTFTARDAVALYEQLADGTILDDFNKETLFDLMLNYPEHGDAVLTGIINQEAASTNLTSAEILAFRNAVDAAWKGGSYNCTFSPNPTRRWRTEGGWARLPFKTSGPLYLRFDREYATAVFLNDSTSSDTVAGRIYDYTWELLRGPIRDALASWDAACNTDSFLSHPADATEPAGGTAEFAAGLFFAPGPRTYRWQKFVSGSWVNVDNNDRISGATTAQLRIDDLGPADAGYYRLRITKECGTINSNAAALTVTDACPADFDGNGQLNFFDFAGFMSAYNTQQASADLASPFGVWNFFDVSAFISLYNAGCP